MSAIIDFDQNILRSEKKYITRSRCYAFELLNFLGAREQHTQRSVASIYFDTLAFNSFFDGEEGSVPRKKYRYRVYNEELPTEKKTKQISGVFEKKETFATGRSKLKWRRALSDINDLTAEARETFQNKQLFPTIYIQYERRYFRLSNVDITVDFNMNACKVTSDYRFLNRFFDDRSVIEVKQNLRENIECPVERKIPLLSARFSKYCEFSKRLLICRT